METKYVNKYKSVGVSVRKVLLLVKLLQFENWSSCFNFLSTGHISKYCFKNNFMFWSYSAIYRRHRAAVNHWHFLNEKKKTINKWRRAQHFLGTKKQFEFTLPKKCFHSNSFSFVLTFFGWMLFMPTILLVFILIVLINEFIRQ